MYVIEVFIQEIFVSQRNPSVMGGKFEGRIFFSRDLWRDGLED
jgi:hypothetical protein